MNEIPKLTQTLADRVESAKKMLFFHLYASRKEPETWIANSVQAFCEGILDFLCEDPEEKLDTGDVALPDPSCPYAPERLIGYPLGMHHCPYCGTMVVAGFTHPKDQDVRDNGCEPYRDCANRNMERLKKEREAEKARGDS